MTTSHFERMPQYGPCPPMRGVVEDSSWVQCHSTPAPLNGTVQLDYDETECIIANGHPMSPVSKSMVDSEDRVDSPGIFRAQSFDVAVFDIRRVPPEQIAAQLTLIDLEIFKAIKMEEFSNCNWTKKEKQRLAPNIVAFTQRFNHTSFLVVREILNEENEKVRAEIIAQFIKIAKKLYEMNNLHSLKAILSALQSTPIHRLSMTWRHIAKKDRSNFDKLADFLSDNENRKALRDHMDAAKLPCIPHLGLYLTDLCFLNDIPNKGSQTESIMNMIAYCQNSTYDNFIIEPHVQKYLTHVRYIDELQKFFEDDNYKLSLKYEPQMTPDIRKFNTEYMSSPRSSNLRASKSHEDLLTQQPTTEETGDTESPFSSQQRDMLTRRSFNMGSTPKHNTSVPTIVKHKHSVSTETQEGFHSSMEVRKTTTLPNNFKETNLTSNFDSNTFFQKFRSSTDTAVFDRKRGDFLSVSSVPSSGGMAAQKGISPSPSLLAKTKKSGRGHTKSQSLGTNVLSVFGVTKPSTPETRHNSSPEPPPTSLSLLDDSLLEDAFPFTPTGSLGNASTSGGSSHASIEDFSEEYHLYRHLEDADELLPGYAPFSGDIIKEGILKRKTLKRRGSSVSQLRGRSKCWVQLTSNSINIMEVKHKHVRKPVKPMKPMDVIYLKACQLKHRDPSEKITEEQFIINDDDGNSTRLTAKSPAAAMEWVVAIKEAIREDEERARKEAERSLIKL